MVVIGGIGVVAAGIGGVAAAGGGEDGALVGTTRTRAVESALAFTGGGTVTEAEVGDDGAAYEVEVRLEDGSAVAVGLDADFVVIGSQPDDDSASGDADEDGDR